MTLEEPLAGPMGARTGVVRVGDTVRRPARGSSAALAALLLHLEAVGFDGAPRYLGRDEKDRDILTYVEGDVPMPPYPAWSMTDDALVGFGQFLRRYHEATASFDARGYSGWAEEFSDPQGGPVVCHNDLFPENVVFRNGRVVGLIDFANAAPGRALWDVAIAAAEWAPLSEPATRLDHPLELDGVARCGRFAHAYGLRADDAEAFVAVYAQERASSLGHIRAEIAAGDDVYAAAWERGGGDRRVDADDAWFTRNRAPIVAAISGAAAGAAHARARSRARDRAGED